MVEGLPNGGPQERAEDKRAVIIDDCRKAAQGKPRTSTQEKRKDTRGSSCMAFAGINYLAVLLAAVASFAFGSVYYMTLAKPWIAAVGKTEAEIKAASVSPQLPFIVAAISQLIMAFMLAGVIGHLGQGQVTIWNGLVSGFSCWIGFVITSMAVNHAFQGTKKSLTLIDGGHWLGVLLIQGGVIGMIGV